MSTITFVKAVQSQADFDAFVALEKEFYDHYESLGIGKQYGRIAFKDFTHEEFKKDFDSCLDEKAFFYYAKEDGRYIGYAYGFLQDHSGNYKIRTIGYLDSILIEKKSRSKGIGKQMIKLFESWLLEQNITFMKLQVKTDNPSAMAAYDALGFKPESLILWKPVEK
jgi:GNAT superfamily N-acetyltransferase